MVASTLARDVVSGLAHRELVDESLWNRLVGRIVGEHGFERSYAERTMNETLAFLQLCASDDSDVFSPSDVVDVGWHTFILYTREYDAFCGRIAGAFIHHTPADAEIDAGPHERCTVDTVAAMRSRGIAVDEELWLVDGECSGKKCYSCSGSQR